MSGTPLVKRFIGAAIIILSLCGLLGKHGGGPPGGGGGTSTPFTTVTYGQFFQYGNGICGSPPCMFGDTFMTTWADDGNIYMTANDTTNFNGGSSSNISLSTINGYTSAMTGTIVNTMSAWGTSGQSNSIDHNTWKSSSILSIGSTLYMFVFRQACSSCGSSLPPFTAQQSSLIISSDHGATWNNVPPAPGGSPGPYSPMMFTDLHWTAQNFVQYPNQAYSGQTADLSNTYVYAIGCDFSSPNPTSNGHNAYIGRVLISAIGNGRASDWSYYQGGDGTNSANWGPLSTAAVIINGTIRGVADSLYNVQPMYLPAFGTYIGFAGQGNNVIILQAPHPWGPWTVVQTNNFSPPGTAQTANGSGFYFPAPVARSVAQNGGVNFTMLSSGSPYTLFGVPVTLSSPRISNEEFVGPFASWMCVKSLASGSCGVAAGGYGTATGNGSTDDTAAIQASLNALSSTHPVLYVPAGTYKITACLFIGTSCTVGTVSPTTLNIAVVCADPATTKILWAGAAAGTMLYVDDVINSSISRCTFDGNHSAKILVAEDQPPSSGGVIGSDGYSDDVFQNAGSSGNIGIGFECGHTAGCSEVELLRDQFIGNTSIGAITMNGNALNMWCWYCTFQNNDVGMGDFANVGSINGAGGFHAFESVFMNSNTADINVGNVVEVTAVGNYSIGSAAFLTAGGLGGGGNFPIFMQGNTVLDTTGSGASIVNQSTNITILLDNVIRSAIGATAPVVNLSNGTYLTNLLSIGNTLTLPTAGNCGGASLPVSINAPFTGSRCHEFSGGPGLDQTVSRGSVNPSAPVLPGTPPNLGRTIYEASPTGSGTTCRVDSPCSVQQAITNAAVGCSNNVAHIPAGTYSVASTITVPANCQLQIIGDGWYSVLSGSSANPILRLNGPSQAMLREFEVNGGNAVDAIEIDSADQIGSLIYGDHVQAATNVTGAATGLFVDGLDFARVELHALLLGGNPGQTGLKVVGGTKAAAGNWQGGATNSFGTNTEGQKIGYFASNGGHLLVVDDWLEEGSVVSNPYSITGANTTFTHAGASLQLSNSPVSNFLNNFQGTSAFLAEASDHTITIGGNGAGANDLIIDEALISTPSNTTDGTPDTMQFLGSTTAGQSPPVPLAEIGAGGQTFLTTTLNQLRTTSPIFPSAPSTGVTNVEIWHVEVGSAVCGIHIEAGTNVTC